jgi:hypothetical protein
MAADRDMDRVAAERAKAAREAEMRKLSSGLMDKRTVVAQLQAQAESLIPEVLRKLAARNYPGLVEISVTKTRKGRHRPGSNTRRGGIPVYETTHMSSHYETEVTDTIYLLSDGYICYRAGAYSLKDFIQYEICNPNIHSANVAFLSSIVSGLAKLNS